MRFVCVVVLVVRLSMSPFSPEPNKESAGTPDADRRLLVARTVGGTTPGH